MTDTSAEPGQAIDGQWSQDIACYYHEPRKLALLRDAFIPLARELEASGLEVSPDRHWLHGPHLRLRLRGGQELVAAGVASALEQLTEWVRHNPSTATLSEADLQAMAEAAGPSELIPPPYLPFFPDNTVRAESTDQAHTTALFGSRQAVWCRNRLLAAAWPALTVSAAYLSQDDGIGRRIRVALTAMAAQAAEYPLGFEQGYQSYLSHVEEFLHFYDADGTIRSRFAGEWTRTSERVCAIVRAVAVDGSDPLGNVWREWSDFAQRAAGDAYRAGELDPVPGAEYARRADLIDRADIVQQWNPQRRTEFSEFHRQRRALDLSKLKWDKEFAGYRFSTNLVYNLLNLLDLAPIERQLAAYLHSEAVQSITGVSWSDLLAGYASRQGGATE